MDDPANPGAASSLQSSQIRSLYTLPVQRYLRIVERLMEMSVWEFLYRIGNRVGRNGFLKSRFRGQYVSQIDDWTDSFLSGCGDDPAAYVESRMADRFFFSGSDKSSITDCLQDACQTDRDAICADADALLGDGLPVLGVKFVADAKQIDWQADPVNRQRYWQDGWIDEAYAISISEADVKHVWEVNRHQYLTTLGRAYWYSGDRRYLDASLALLDSWIDANPVGRGVNWCSHLEVGVRSISWLWSMPLLMDGLASNERITRKWLGSVVAHYYHLSKNLSVYTDPTNHLIGEATALWMLTVCFPELPNAEKNRKLSSDLIELAIDEQNFADGVNKEQATSYHRFVLDFFVQYKLLSEKNFDGIPDELNERVQKMFEFAAALAGVGGYAPMIGDSDDARGVPFLELVTWDYRDLLSTGSVLYSKSAWKSDALNIAPITVWLMGSNAKHRFDALPVAANGAPVRYFADGGYSFLDNAADDANAELIFDCGELGLWPNAAHGHADALSVQVRVNGEFLLGDPGTGAYFHSTAMRDTFRATKAHNTVSIAGRDQADIFGPFKWVNPFRIAQAGYVAGSVAAVSAASHNGYSRLVTKAGHERAVFSIRGMGWLILDQIDAAPEQTVTRHFNCAPGAVVSHAESGLFQIEGSGGALMVEFAERDQLAAVEVQSDALWSERYGKVSSTAAFHVSGNGGGPLLTLITPISERNARDVTLRIVTQALDNGGVLYTIDNSDNSERRAVLFVRGKSKIVNTINKIETDGDALLYIVDGQDRVEQCIVLGNRASASGGALKGRVSRNGRLASYEGI